MHDFPCWTETNGSLRFKQVDGAGVVLRVVTRSREESNHNEITESKVLYTIRNNQVRADGQV